MFRELIKVNVIGLLLILLAGCQDSVEPNDYSSLEDDQILELLEQHYLEVETFYSEGSDNEIRSSYQNWYLIQSELHNRRLSWITKDNHPLHVTIVQNYIRVFKDSNPVLSEKLVNYAQVEIEREALFFPQLSRFGSTDSDGEMTDCAYGPDVGPGETCEVPKEDEEEDEDEEDSSSGGGSTPTKPTAPIDENLTGPVNQIDQNINNLSVQASQVDDLADINIESIQEQQIDELKEEDKSSQIANPSCTTANPVKLSCGVKSTQSIDLDIGAVRLFRDHSIEHQSSWSIGKGWLSSLDSRIILGVSSDHSKKITELKTTQEKYSEIISQLKSEKDQLLTQFSCYSGTPPAYSNYKINTPIPCWLTNANGTYTLTTITVKNAVLANAQEHYDQAISEITSKRDAPHLVELLNNLVAEQQKNDLHHLANRFVVDENNLQEEVIGNHRIKWITDSGNSILFSDVDNNNDYQAEGGHSHQLTILEDGYLITSVNNQIYRYNLDGFLLSKYDSSGNGIVLSRQGNIISNITDDKGRSYGINYTGKRITTISDPIGRTLTYFYDQKERLIKVINFSGEVEEYQYGYVTEPVAITKKINSDISGDGIPEVYQYDYKQYLGKPVVSKQTLPNGYFWTYEYDFSNPEEKSTKVFDLTKGQSSTYLHYVINENNQTVERMTSWKNASVTFEYDDQGNRIAANDEEYKTTQYEYDGRGQITAVINGEGHRVEYTKDRQGLVLSRQDANGTTIYHRDANDQIDYIQQADGSVIDETWVNNRLTKRVDASGVITQWNYDVNGYPSSKAVYDDAIALQTGELTAYQTYNYDAIGRLLQHRVKVNESQYHQTSYTYNDTLGRQLTKPVTVTDPAGRVAVYQYDNQLNVIKHKDFSGVITLYRYNAMGDVVQKTQQLPAAYSGGLIEHNYFYQYDGERNLIVAQTPGDVVWQYEYNGDGKLTHAKLVGTNTAISYEYDLAGNKVSEHQQGDMNAKQWHYNESGKIASVVNELGGQTEFLYNQTGVLTQVNQNYQMQSTIERNALNQVVAQTNGQYDRLESQINKNGQTTGIYAPNSNQLRVERQLNALGQVVQQSNADGVDMTREYNLQGLLVAYTDTNGGQWKFEYDALNRKVKQVSANGLQTSWLYEQKADHLMVSKTQSADDQQRVTIEHYDLLGKLIFSQDALGQQWYYQYNQRQLLAKVIEPSGSFTGYQYDIAGALIEQSYVVSNGDLRTTTYHRDAQGRVSSKVEPNGLTFDYQYNDLDQVTAVYREGILLNEKQYDSLGRVTAIQRADGVGEQMQYNSNHQIIEKIASNGSVWQYQYNGDGQIKTITDPSGKQVHYQQDVMGRSIERLDQLGNSQKQTFNGAGQVKKIIDANQVLVQEYQYNEAGQLTAKTDAMGQTTQYQYNGFGELTQVINAKGLVTQFEYDALGRRIKVTDVQNQTNEFEYNYRNQMISMTDRLNQTETRQYDDFGNLSQLTQASDVYSQGLTTQYQYDDSNNLTAVTNARGYTREYQFDVQNRMTTATDEMGRQTHYGYNDFDQMTQVADHNHNPLIQNQYNELNKLSVRSFKDQAGQWQQDSYHFDQFGRMDQIESKNYVEQYTYDAVGNRTQTHNQTLNQSIQYQFDANNREVTLTDSSSQSEYVRNAKGQISQVIYNGETTTLHRDELGQVIARDLANGIRDLILKDELGQISATVRVGPQSNKNYTDYDQFVDWKFHHQTEDKFQYQPLFNELVDKVDELNDSLPTLSGTEVQYYAYYFRDANGNLIAQNINGRWSTMEYDQGRNQLLAVYEYEENVRNYEWDEAGNMTLGYSDWSQREFTYDASNKISSSQEVVGHGNANERAYQYDERGNLTQISTANGALAYHDQWFGYDSLGRMTESGMVGDGSPVYFYQYDALDRRTHAEKGNREGKVAGNFNTISLYDGRQERAQWSKDVDDYGVESINEYRKLNYVPNAVAGVYGQLIHQELAQSTRDEFQDQNGSSPFGVSSREKQFFHQDHQSSTVGLTDQAGQGIINYLYSDQGEAKAYHHGNWPNKGTAALWGNRHINPYLYTGKFSDPASSLVHMDARWYNPRVGRFLQPDYYNFQQLALPGNARHQLVKFMGLNTNGLLRDPSQQMRYGYVAGNMLSWVDPFGLAGICEGCDVIGNFVIPPSDNNVFDKVVMGVLFGSSWDETTRYAELRESISSAKTMEELSEFYLGTLPTKSISTNKSLEFKTSRNDVMNEYIEDVMLGGAKAVVQDGVKNVAETTLLKVPASARGVAGSGFERIDDAYSVMDDGSTILKEICPDE